MENNTSASTTPIPAMSPRLHVAYWEQIFTAILIVLISVTGMIGNSMMIVAVSFSSKLQTSTNAFVTSLSVADLLSSFFLIWYTVGLLGKNGWPIPQAHWICDLTGFMVYACRGTTVYNLGAIAVNRFLLITKPFLYRKIFTSWKLGILVAIPWIVPWISFAILPATGIGAFGYDSLDLSCGVVQSHTNSDVLFHSVLLIGFPIPLLAIIVSYTLIYIFLRRYFREKKLKLQMNVHHVAGSDIMNMSVFQTDVYSSGQPASTSEIKMEETTRRVAKSVRRRKQISQKQIEITKNLFLIVCSIFLCFLPYLVVVGIPNSEHALFYTRIITLSNCAMNFAINARKHPDFRIVIGCMIRGTYADIPHPSRLLSFLLAVKNK